MNIKQLKQYIQDLPDDMEVHVNPAYVYELKSPEPTIEGNVLILQ